MIERCEQVAYFVAGFKDNRYTYTNCIGNPAHSIAFGIICSNPLQNKWREGESKGYKRESLLKLAIAYFIYTCFYG